MNARSEVRVRPATTDDALAMSRIHFAAENAALDDWDAGVHMEGDVEDAAYPFTQPPSEGEHRFVAEIDGGVVAWLLVNTETHELDGLYVDPEHQRQGIGAALLEKADELLSGSAPAASLWVMTRHTSARAFYEAHGWEPDPTQTRNITMESVGLPQLIYTKRFS